MDFVALIVGGVALGCVYALMASGIVLTFKTSGVFNLGLGAQAYASAAIFYTLSIDLGWPILPSLIVAVFILSPLLGLGLYWGLFRYTQGASETVRLMVGLGVLLLLPALIQALYFGTDLKGNPPVAIPGADRVFELAGLRLGGDRLVTIILTIVVVVGLAALFRYSMLGLRMRAVVESPRMVQLAGIDASSVASVSWMLSGFVAGLAGVLLAPLFGSIEIANYTVLLVAAIAAAVVGRLSSLPMTLAGGLLLGLAQVVLNRYLPADSVFSTGLKSSLPFLLLFGLLVFVPKFRTLGGVTDPLSGVDPPRKSLRAPVETTTAAARNRFGTTVLVSALIVAFAALAFSDVWLFRISNALVLAIILLSFTVLTGMAGQISLGQAAFAGIGGFTAAQIAFNFNFPIFWGIVGGAVAASIVGAVLALPLRRIRGIYLTLATLAFGLMVDQIIFPLDWVGGGPAGLEVARPFQAGVFDFSNDRSFFLLCAVLFALLGFFVWRLRDGTVGQMLDAIRGSDVGAASVGIDPGRAKIIAFAVASFIAGLGGGLLVSLQQRATAADFGIGSSLLWAVIIIVLGARSIVAALAAGLFLALFPEFLRLVGVPAPELWVAVVFGAGALVFVKTQEGLLDWLIRESRGLIQRINPREGRELEVPPAPPVIDLTAAASAAPTNGAQPSPVPAAGDGASPASTGHEGAVTTAQLPHTPDAGVAHPSGPTHYRPWGHDRARPHAPTAPDDQTPAAPDNEAALGGEGGE